jgi:type II secretion system protein H
MCVPCKPSASGSRSLRSQQGLLWASEVIFTRTGQNKRRPNGFTLIELILVLALLVIITSIATPRMAKFIRGRALDTEMGRVIALMHMAQSRAVSEGMPVLVWINTDASTYGMITETPSKTGDPKAEVLNVDSTVKLGVINTGVGTQTQYNKLPAIRFLADGTIDENSPQSLKLMDVDGFSRLLTETRLRNGYELTAAQ